ncbi:3-ketosteroid-9-alpha-hydroxylase [Rhodococcus ruber]|uniref:Rieske 2Fe-2S domain-containing protein n=1 Tax=Rhodococcus TaxID=1827 RepID=UPI00029A5780|nr:MULTISPECIES: Rieske 2Fe-2S domain-containing protein [Rhodococcus]ATQ29053.1 3-ketosteroid-9-alpha-hydroxylase [Rhodococcus ruber]
MTQSAPPTTPHDEVRTIEADAAPTRFARGWHCLGLARTYRDGKPHQVDVFGTSLVVFADSTGELQVLDAYCRHMGGNLAQGEIKGDSVACPFHDWRWGGNGRCTGIPYARRVPPLARTRSWTTLERNQQLFVWHDPEGNPPPADVTIPAIEGAGTDEWSDWTWNSVLIEGSHCREIVDNVVDMAHFFYVHYSVPRSFENIFDGHVATQIMSFNQRTDVELDIDFGADNFSRSEASYHGPSYMIDKLWTETGEATIETVLVNCHYPVTPTSFVLQYGVIVKRLPGMSAEEANAMAAHFGGGTEKTFEQDIEIWKNKAKIDNPLLCDEDGPVYQLRRWYQQFYVDVADITPDMTNRYEFAIDTTKPAARWEQQIAENLAARAESAPEPVA